MKQKIKNLFAAAALVGVLLGVSGTAQAIAATATLRFVQTPTITLYASISASATTMRITPYPKDLDGTKLTMNDFGSTSSATIDPKVRNIEEIVTFTGITDNGDNTATITGLSRDLTSKYPYTTPGTGRQHAAGAVVVFSNNPQMYNRLAAPENTQTWTSVQTFTNTALPTLNADLGSWIGVPAATLVSKGYVDSVAVAGASNADTATKGIVQIATAVQVASSTKLGSTGANLSIPSLGATSTPIVGCNSTTVIGALCVVVARNDGKITPQFIATSTTDAYNFGGQVNFGKNPVTPIASTTYSGSTVNMDWASTTQMVQLNQSTTVTFSNVQAGMTIRAVVCQDGTGSRTVSSWPATIRWQTGFAPTLTTTANKCDLISFLTGSSTTSVFGAASANF